MSGWSSIDSAIRSNVMFVLPRITRVSPAPQTRENGGCSDCTTWVRVVGSPRTMKSVWPV
eukprot:6630793-Prymnesium_polylepis.1